MQKKTIAVEASYMVLILSGVWYTVSFLSFFLGFSISVIGLILTIGICSTILYKFSYKPFVLFPTLLIVFSILTFISKLLLDVSWDGQEYHQETILQLAAGWNPIFEYLPDSVPHAIWINHYGKSAEIVQTAFFLITGNIETGKALNLLLLLATFFVVFDTLSSYLPLKRSDNALVSAIIALNPVVITQVWSYYIDGLLASLITILICLYIDVYKKKMSTLKWLALGSTLLILINIKFTGLLYAGFFTASIFVLMMIKGNGIKEIMSLSVQILIYISILGFNPYTLNTLEFNHPFYPLFGENNANFTDDYAPRPFADKLPPMQLISSIFSEAMYADGTTEKQPGLKIPFTFSIDELRVYVAPDARVAGFGPIFSGILLLCLIGLFFLIKSKLIQKSHVALFSILLISVFIMPEAWSARYVPQFWIVVTGILVLLFTYEKKIWAYSLSLLFILNIGIVTAVNSAYQISTSDIVQSELDYIDKHQKDLRLNYSSFASIRERIRSFGNDITIDLGMDFNPDTCAKLTASEAFICRDDAPINIEYNSIIYNVLGKRLYGLKNK